jgi:hypothetical protein
MTKKTSILTDLDEILEYLDIDKPTLRRALQEGIKRLLGPPIDARIEPYLHGDPEKINSLEV